MIPFISRLFHLPVTRKEVLKRAKKLKRAGLCFSIDEALRDYGIDLSYAFVVKYFPKFRREEALKSEGGGEREPGIMRAKGTACLKKGRMIDCQMTSISHIR